MCRREPPGPAPRSLLQRWFGPMRAGSLRSGLLVLTTTAMGAGVLALPFAIRELGWGLGSFAVLAFAALNVASLDLLLDAGMRYGATSYSELICIVRGPRAASVLDLTVSIITWGATVAYWVFIKQLLPMLLVTLGAPAWLARAEVALPALAVLVFAIALPRDITAMGKFSVLGVCSVMYVCFFLVFSACTAGVGLGALPAVAAGTDTRASAAGLANACALVISGFLCQYNVFFIYTDVKEPTVRRLRKITRFSTLFQAVCYLTLGLCGFATFGPWTRDDIYTNFLADDPWANLGRLLVCASLCVSIPLCVFGARCNLVALLSRLLPAPAASEVGGGEPQGRETTAMIDALAHNVGSFNRLYSLSRSEEAEEQGVHWDNPMFGMSRTSSFSAAEGRAMFGMSRTSSFSQPSALPSPAVGARSVLQDRLSMPFLQAQAVALDDEAPSPGGVVQIVEERCPSKEEIAQERRKVEGELGASGWLLHVLATAVIVAATLALAFAVPSVSYLLGKLGGVCGVTQMYLMPGLVLLSCPELRPPLQRAAILLGFCAASATGLAAVVL